MTEMPPYEKEEIFSEELHKLINHFCQEYDMTYAQIIGCLEIVKSELVHEGFITEDQNPIGEDDEPEQI